MATDRLTRLADALLEVGHRIDEISAELRHEQALRTDATTPKPTDQPAGSPLPLGHGDLPTDRSVPHPSGDLAALTNGPTAPFPPAGHGGSPADQSAGDAPFPAPPTLQYPPVGDEALPPAPVPFWRREGFGARSLAMVGATVTLAGVVLLLVLAVQRGYLGPLPRVLLGVALGLGLAGVGLWLHRTPAGRVGALACAATGITVLYLDVVAATVLFGQLPPAAGLVAGLVVAAVGVLLADRWDAEPLAVFVVVGCAVSAPVITGGFTPLLLGFLLVLQLGTTPVYLARRWPVLCLAAALPAVLGTAAAVVFDATGVESPTIALLGMVTSLAQVGVAVAGALREGGLAPVGQVLLAPVPVMVVASLVPQVAAVALPGTVGALLVLVWVLGFGKFPPSFAKVAGAAGLVAILQATLTAVDGSVAAIVLLAQALLLTLVARAARYPAALTAAVVFAVTGLGFTLLDAAPLELLVVAPEVPVPAHVAATAGLTGLLLAVTAVAMCVTGRRWLATAGVVTLYGAAAAVLSATLLVSPDDSGFVLGHVLVTVSWTVGALVLLARGIDSVFARTAGLSLVGAALAKLVLFDLSSLDGMARVAVFLVAGLVLLAAGTRYAKVLRTGWR